MHNIITDLVSLLSISGCVTAGIYSYKYLPGYGRIILLQAILALLAETAGTISSVHKIQNNLLFNIYLLGDICLAGWAIIKLLPPGRFRYAAFFIIVFNCLYLIKETLSAGNRHFAVNAFLIESTFVTISFLFIFLHRLFRRQASIINRDWFWLCLANILFYGCNIPFFSVFNYLNRHEKALAENLYHITHIVSFIRYVFTGIAFLLTIPKPGIRYGNE